MAWSATRGEPGSDACVLLLHGLDSSPTTLRSTADAVVEALPSSYVLIPTLPLRWHECVDLRAVARELLDHLLDVLGEHRYERVFLIGHSAGGILAQAVFLLAAQAAPPEMAGRLARARLVLIAPLSRGWVLSHHLPLSKKLAWMIGLLSMPLVRGIERVRSVLAARRPEEPWILQVRRSSPFLIGIRMAWLDIQRRSPADSAEVVQLLGSIDELVSWREVVEPAGGTAFIYLQVPSSDHVDIVDLDDPLFGRARTAAFSMALADIEEARRSEWAVEPWDVDPLPPDPHVKRVLFVIHGIRDVGHWTQKIAVLAKRHYASLPGHSPHEIEVVTSTYGYFSMLQFLWFRERRKKVNWLVEEYLEAKRRFPSAEFSYIGHSHGTYLVAHAMERFPQIEFERLALAGSVLSSRFDWQRIRSQAQYVLNLTATSDWVVGIFPRIADLLPVDWLFGPSLGGAGIAGFEDAGVQTLGYRKGAHSAAIEEENWPYLARFAVDDSPDFEFPIERPDDFEVEYRPRRVGPFEGRWGIVTCIGGWILVLAAALVGLPWLAWMKPAYLWIAPLPLLGGAILAAASSESLSAGSELRRRKRLRRRLFSLLLSLVIAGYIALLLSPFTGSLSQWNDRSGDGLRMASTLFYFWCLHRALTRV